MKKRNAAISGCGSREWFFH